MRDKNKTLFKMSISIGILLIIFISIGNGYTIKEDVWGNGVYPRDMIEGKQYDLFISCTGRGPDIVDIKIVDESTSETILDISRECLYYDDTETPMHYYENIPTFTCQKSGRYKITTTASDSKSDYQIRFAEKSAFRGISLTHEEAKFQLEIGVVMILVMLIVIPFINRFSK